MVLILRSSLALRMIVQLNRLNTIRWSHPFIRFETCSEIRQGIKASFID
jgi:hypothetical protein